jgi:hypothetical protein
MMQRRRIVAGLLAVMTTLSIAAPGPRSAKADVTGTIVDYNRRASILILSNFQGWDRKQMEQARFVEHASIRRWFESLEENHAPIYIKKDDLKGLRKGQRIKITGYSYFSDEWMIFADYDKVEIIR